MNQKSRRNIFRATIIAALSMLTLVFFQNCGGAINSQGSSSTAAGSSGGNSTNGTNPSPSPSPGVTPAPTPVPVPVPVPVPAPTPGGTALLPQTTALKEQLCNPFINPNVKAAYTLNPTNLTEVIINSGAGNGAAAVGNGDSINGNVKIDFNVLPAVQGNIANSQGIVPPAQYIQSPLINCAFNVVMMTEVVTVDYTDSNGRSVSGTPSFSKAIDVKPGSLTYGQNIAVGADVVKMKLIAERATDFTATTINPVASTAGILGLNLQRNADGLRCVEGSFSLRISVRTQVENSNITKAFDVADANYKYVKVIVKDNCWAESRLVPAIDPVKVAGYGSVVAASSNWMAVLANKDDGIVGGATVAGTGSVTMFKKNNSSWSYCQKITLPAANALIEPLSSVAVSEDGKLVIGNAYVKDSAGTVKAGAVYLYNYNSSIACGSSPWVYKNKISAESFSNSNAISANKNQLFGASVALNNNYLVIGAPAANSNNGAMYVYSCTATDCSYLNAMPNSTGTQAALGSSLAISGQVIAVGAPQAFGLEDLGDGFADIYEISGSNLNLKTKLRPTDLSGELRTNMRFGESVSVSANRVVVGAPYRVAVDNTNKIYAAAGAAYYYNYDSTKTSIPTSSVVPRVRRIVGNDVANLFVGRAVALVNDGVVIGVDGDAGREGRANYINDANLLAATSGAFKFSVGAGQFSLFSMDKTASNDFGYSIAVSGQNIIVGARVKPSPNASGGAAYVFLKP